MKMRPYIAMGLGYEICNNISKRVMDRNKKIFDEAIETFNDIRNDIFLSKALTIMAFCVGESIRVLIWPIIAISELANNIK